MGRVHPSLCIAQTTPPSRPCQVTYSTTRRQLGFTPSVVDPSTRPWQMRDQRLARTTSDPFQRESDVRRECAPPTPQEGLDVEQVCSSACDRYNDDIDRDTLAHRQRSHRTLAERPLPASSANARARIQSA